MHEKRLTTRLITYWERTKGSADFPAYQQINPSAIDDIWQNCLALHVQPKSGGMQHYVYAHCGETVTKALGKNMRGQMLASNMRLFPGARIIKRIDEVVTRTAATPLLDDGQFVNDNGKVIKYRACLLACGANGIVSHVIIGVSWREF